MGGLEGPAARVAEEAQLLAWAQAFVAIASPTGGEGPLGEAFAQALAGVGAELLAAPDAAGNVLARVKGDGTGPSVLVLVPLDNEAPGPEAAWPHPPLAGVLADGRLHGAGVAHHKAAMAALVGAAQALVAQGGLRGDFLIAGVAGGGHRGGVGVRALSDATLPGLGLHADFAVMAQASGLEVVLGHRGRLELELVVLGRVANAAAPWLGQNAVSMARWVLEAVESLAGSLPTHPYLDRATLTPVGIESGPAAWGRVPDRCSVHLDRRFLPSEAVDAVVMQLQSIANRLADEHPDFQAELRVRSAPLPGGGQVARLMHPLAAEPAHALVRRAVAAIRGTGLPAGYGRWAFSSDVGYLAAVKGLTAIGFGPGEELLAHSPQESVPLGELRHAASAYAALAWAIAGP